MYLPSTQAEAVSATPVAAGERTRFFRVARQRDLECLSATFRVHVYAPHSHDTFVVGVVEAGCEVFRLRGEMRAARPGDLCFVNPGEVHDGAPADDGYAYRMTYPSTALLDEIAEDLSERRPGGSLSFRAPIVADPQLAGRFSAAHRSLEARGAALESDERLHRVYAAMLSRYAGVAVSAGGREGGPVARAIAFLDAHYDEDVDLARLAAIADVPRTRLIRAMKAETGLTPHAWLTDRRVKAARQRLAAGERPAAVATACGFFDQSHLNRAFKARLGVTPGAFRDAVVRAA